MAFLRRDTFTGVSIHAPARGATAPPLKAEQNMSFNPRAREGRDPFTLRLFWLWSFQFQSTRPRGARPDSTVHDCASHAFQSTRPRGARRFEV